jgi:hypothetical protein
VAEVIGEVNRGVAMGEDGQAYGDAEHHASRRRYGVWQVPGGITGPWMIPHPYPLLGRDGCTAIGSYDRAQELLGQGHRYPERNGDGEACESLRR